MSFPRPAWWACTLVLTCTAVAGLACNSRGSAKATPAVGQTAASAPSGVVGGAGALLITGPDALSEYNLASRQLVPLITPTTPNTFILDPAISRDGQRLVYAVQPPPKVSPGSYDGGSDLWVADRDGSQQRPIFIHRTPNQLVRFPQWEDAEHVLAIVQEISNSGGVTDVTYTLERIPLDGSPRTTILEDVLAFGLSPDRRRVVYVKLTDQPGETLDAMDLAGGGNPTTLVGLDQNLNPFNSPRFSPDGTKIAFTSADQTGARAPFELVSAGGRDAAPLPDGLPEDAWTIDAPGGAAQRVADLKEDLPALDWSGDGKHLYVVGAAGLYDVNLQNGATTRLGDGSFHAQIVWTP